MKEFLESRLATACTLMMFIGGEFAIASFASKYPNEAQSWATAAMSVIGMGILSLMKGLAGK